MPRTINDIIPPSRRRAMGDIVPPTSSSEPSVPPPPPAPPPPGLPPRPPAYPRPRRRFPWGMVLIAVIVILACVGTLYAFAGAKVEVTPTTNTGPVSGTFTASPSGGDLPFQVVSVQKVASESIAAESTVTANDSAQGTITIYNTQSKAQPLVTNTRFESPDGHIFRIHQAVSVPAGSGVTPGSLTATVYADSPGADYNIAPTTFSVPGLAGTPEASDVYAKSATAMAGGFSGTRPSVDQATDDAEHAKLQSTLASEIDTAIAPQIPSGYVLVPGATTVDYSPLPDTGDTTTSGNVDIKEQATITAVVFPEGALADQIAQQVIGQSYTGEPVTLESVKTLTLTPAATTTVSATDPFSFTLSGSATIVWTIDPAKISGAVAGKSRAAAQSVLTGFPEVGRASLLLRPFWRSTFPSDPADITIVVDNPTGS